MMKNICKLVLILAVLPSAHAIMGEVRENTQKFPITTSLLSSRKPAAEIYGERETFKEREGPSLAKKRKIEEKEKDKANTSATESQLISQSFDAWFRIETIESASHLLKKLLGDISFEEFSTALKETSPHIQATEETEDCLSLLRELGESKEEKANSVTEKTSFVDETIKSRVVGSPDPLPSYSSSVAGSKATDDKSPNCETLPLRIKAQEISTSSWERDPILNFCTYAFWGTIFNTHQKRLEEIIIDQLQK